MQPKTMPHRAGTRSGTYGDARSQRRGGVTVGCGALLACCVVSFLFGMGVGNTMGTSPSRTRRMRGGDETAKAAIQKPQKAPADVGVRQGFPEASCAACGWDYGNDWEGTPLTEAQFAAKGTSMMRTRGISYVSLHGGVVYSQQRSPTTALWLWYFNFLCPADRRFTSACTIVSMSPVGQKARGSMVCRLGAPCDDGTACDVACVCGTPGPLPEVKYLLAGINNGLVVDCGTNMGFVTNFAAALGHRVRAIEAQVDNYKMALSSVTKNGFLDRVRLYHRAAHWQKEPLTLSSNYYLEDGGVKNSGASTRRVATRVTVPHTPPSPLPQASALLPKSVA